MKPLEKKTKTNQYYIYINKYKGLLNHEALLNIKNNSRVELSFFPLECGLGLVTHFQGIEFAKGGIVAL